MARFNENGLTEKQQRILDFVGGYIGKRGISPSNEEISEGTGYHYGNISTVLYALESRGLIERNNRHEGGRITLVKKADADAHIVEADEIVEDKDFGCFRFNSDFQKLPRVQRKCLVCTYEFVARGSSQRLCNYCRADPLEARESIRSSDLKQFFPDR